MCACVRARVCTFFAWDTHFTVNALKFQNPLAICIERACHSKIEEKTHTCAMEKYNYKWKWGIHILSVVFRGPHSLNVHRSEFLLLTCGCTFHPCIFIYGKTYTNCNVRL